MEHKTRATFPAATYIQILSYFIPATIVIIFTIAMPCTICDDAFITLKVAKNFVAGNGFVFNLGQKVYVTTTPLFAFLISIITYLGVNAISATQLIGFVAELLLVWSLVYFGRLLFQDERIGMLSAILLITNPVVLYSSHSGMETCLYLFLIIFAVILFEREKYEYALLISALSVWARFDGLLFFVVLSSCFIIKRGFHISMKHILESVLPATVLVSTYFAFGYFYFDDIIPNSVKVKATIDTIGFFNKEWLFRGWIVSIEFIKAFLGYITSIDFKNYIFFILPIPFFIACRKLAWETYIKILPLGIFCMLYAGAGIVKASFLSLTFPWYFVPHLPVLYIVSAAGIYMVCFYFSENSAFLKKIHASEWLSLVVGSAWAIFMYFPNQNNTTESYKIFVERERVYAAASLWANSILPPNSTIASNEIGTIGFYTRPDIEILDLFGIARMKNERRLYFMKLLEKRMPEGIFIRNHFDCIHELKKSSLWDRYEWFSFKTLEIGIKKNIASDKEKNKKQILEKYVAAPI